jgi:proton-dependent oligopeptide transporter, POT family
MNPPLTHAGAGAATTADTAFFGHPRGLSTLFFAEMWERFSYYGMRAFLILYMTTPVAAGGMAMADSDATSIYGTYTGAAWGAAILGGIVGDRWLGQYRSVLLGGVLIMLGHFSLVFRALPFFYAGLALIVIGTGLLKPSVSTLVGSLYPADDPRRDRGFSIFYMGINIGAIAGPLAAGYLAQEVDWHIGFGAAGVGMALGLTQLVLGRRYIQAATDRIATGIAARSGAAGVPVATAQSSGLLGFTPGEWKRLAAIGVFFVCGVLFFAGFEQQGSSMNLFAQRYTRLDVFGFSFPASWFQSVPPVFVVLFVPLFTWIWARLGDREPSISGKFALGLFFMALAILVMIPAGAMAQSGEGIRVSPWWLVVSFALAEFGEICLYPVGMSAVTKLSPPRIVGLMMGVWFLALAFGNKLAGWVAGFIESMPLESLFLTLGGTIIAASIIMALLIKPVSKLTGEAK